MMVLFSFKFLRYSINFEKFLQTPDLEITSRFPPHLTKATFSLETIQNLKQRMGYDLSHCFSFLLEFYCIIPNQRGCHWRCFIKAIFSKYEQRSTCFGVFFNKVLGWRPTNLLKRDSNTDVYLWILKNFKNTFLTERHRATASETHHQSFSMTKFCS